MFSKRKTRKRKSRSEASQYEKLEERQVLTGVASAFIYQDPNVGPVLTVVGTDCPDTIGVSYNSTNTNVNLNGTNQSFQSSTFNAIRIYGNDGNDNITYSTGLNSLGATIYGGDGNDIITGSNSDDFINGNTGNDRIRGNKGDDTLVGEAGNDTIRAGDGDDLLVGNIGDDILVGETGSDSIGGLNGDDIIYGDNGQFTQQNYWILNSGVVPSAVIGPSNDVVNGGNNDDTIYGGEGNDTLNGDFGVDTIFGQTGNDLITGDLAVDRWNNVGQGDFLYGNEGNDTIWGGGGDDFIQGDQDPLRYGLNGTETLFNTTSLIPVGGFSAGGDDILYGGYGNDRLVGMQGDDDLRGHFGDDILEGGLPIPQNVVESNLLPSLQAFPLDMGDDSMIGQSGNDTFRIFAAEGDHRVNGGSGNLDRLEYWYISRSNTVPANAYRSYTVANGQLPSSGHLIFDGAGIEQEFGTTFSGLTLLPPL